MARVFYYGTIILAVVGLGVSLLIFPGDDEVAFLQYKDKYYSKAMVLYEMQIEKNNYSPQVVTPLADLYLKYGYVDKAIGLMEDFIGKNPHHLDALKKLGLYYQYAQRYDDYLQTLETIYQISPNPETLRNLSKIHNFNGNFSRQLAVLEELTTRFSAEKQDYIDLAYLYARRKEYQSAVSTLERYVVTSKKTDPFIIELMMSLLLNTGQPQKAYVLAGESLTNTSDEATALRYAKRLHTSGETDLAYSLLQPFQKGPSQSPALLQELVTLEIVLNKKEVAFTRLAELFDHDQLSTYQLEPFLTLLLERDDMPRLQKLVRMAQLDWLTQEQLITLVDRFSQRNDQRSLDQIYQKITPALRSEFPILDVKLAITRNNKNIDPVAEATRNHPWLTDRQRVQLALMYAGANMTQASQTILSDVTTLEDVEYSDLYDITTVYIQSGLAQKGLNLVDRQYRQKSERPTEEQNQLEASAIRLAMAVGLEDRVLSYLNSSKKPDVQQLTDLYYLAEASGNANIMLETSRVLIKDSLPTDTRFLGFYIEALLATENYREALPYLKQLADQNEQNWIYIYADVLEKLDLDEDWKTFWVKQARREDLNRLEKRSIAYALLEKGFKNEAREVFYDLSENRGPDDPDVNQLVYLMEIHKDMAGPPWLNHRIKTSGRAETSQWVEKYYRLVNGLGVPQLVEVFVNTSPDHLNQITELDMANGRQAVAYQRLKDHYQQNRLQAGSKLVLLRQAFEYRDESVIKQLALEKEIQTLDQVVLINLFSVILNMMSADDIRLYQTNLGEPFFKAYALVDVMFDIALTKTIDLNRVEIISADASVGANERLVLAEFLVQFGLKEEASELISGAVDPTALSKDEILRIANLYLLLGRPEVGLRLFDHQSDLIKAEAALSSEEVTHIHILLATAAGKTNEVLAIIRQGGLSFQMVTDIYYIANDYKRPVIALAAAKARYQLQPNVETLSSQTRALVQNKKYQEALPGLEELYQQNPVEWEFTYLEVLEKTGGKQTILSFWKRQAEQLNISPERRREIAFTLLEKGFRNEAEELFLQLSESAKADSQSVKQLLYLWGVRPQPHALAWVENRLQTAIWPEKAGWLNVLVGIGQDEIASQYVERNAEKATTEMIDIWLEITVLQKDHLKFKQIASQEIKYETNLSRLKKIADLAAQLNLSDVTIEAYEKAYQMAPDDKEILNRYGKLTYYQGDFERSEVLLKTFVDTGGLDHISAFLVGEMLWLKRLTREAKKYYRKALDQMSLLIEKSIADKTLEARIMIRLGDKEAALAVYRILRQQHPENATLKAEYIELLLDLGYTEEADRLLTDI